MKKKKKTHQPFKTEGEQRLAFKPDAGTYIPVKDVRDKIKQVSEESGPSRAQRQAFYQDKIRLIESTRSPYEHKNKLLEDLKRTKQEDEDEEEPPDPRPRPGGVGYGTYYRKGKLVFEESSVLNYHIVTVRDIGDEKNRWLYLTSTNRSPRGVEAFVSYEDQDEPKFIVFDWSKKDKARWQQSTRYSMLGDYVLTYAAGGREYQTLNVMNSTRKVAGHTWVNEVFLYNRQNNSYDRIYLSDEYTLTPLEELEYLWWGPIIETFSPFPYTTDIIGFFEAQLSQDNEPPKLLSKGDTYLKKEYATHPGFELVYGQDQPYSFTVRWTV